MDPTGLTEAIGPIATLANTLAEWFLKPGGYATWSRERQIKALHDLGVQAWTAGQYDVVGTVLTELKRLSDSTPS